MQPEVPAVKCPKCGSEQITSGKKGFSGTKAVGGALLTGGIGLLAGTIGSNKIRITCLNCGHQFKPGDKPAAEKETDNKLSPEAEKTGCILVLIIAAVCLLYYFIDKI